VGSKPFFGLDLLVDKRVLVPRPDTETLVEWALTFDTKTSVLKVLDMGTGSGAIALALKSVRPDWQVTALDASADALAVAQNNAKRLNLNVNFLQSSWFDALP
jgi:release factor glutamine methyltransferase